jgi:hypothetical protein
MPPCEGCIETYIHNAFRAWPMDRSVCPTGDQVILPVNTVDGYLGPALLLKY